MIHRDNRTNSYPIIRFGEILEQSNGNATRQLVATETATKYLVENTQLRNQVAAQEREVGALH